METSAKCKGEYTVTGSTTLMHANVIDCTRCVAEEVNQPLSTSRHFVYPEVQIHAVQSTNAVYKM